MGLPLASRKITTDDHLHIAMEVSRCVDRMKAGTKAICRRLDEISVMSHIMTSSNAWIVDDTFLVVYAVVCPWYAPRNTYEIREELVLRLQPGSDFSVVPEFLAQRMEAEGACLTAVGTALASSDDALASKYEQHGFLREAALLTKES